MIIGLPTRVVLAIDEQTITTTPQPPTNLPRFMLSSFDESEEGLAASLDQKPWTRQTFDQLNQDEMQALRQNTHPHDVGVSASLNYPMKIMDQIDLDEARASSVTAATVIGSIIIVLIGVFYAAGCVCGCFVWFCCRGPDHEFVQRRYTLNHDIQDENLARHRLHHKKRQQTTPHRRQHHESDDDT